MPSKNKICMLPKNKFLVPIVSPMLVLVEGEEKECVPKFGVLIFILAHEIKQVSSLSWKHCMTGYFTWCGFNTLLQVFQSHNVLARY